MVFENDNIGLAKAADKARGGVSNYTRSVVLVLLIRLANLSAWLSIEGRE